MRPDLMRKICLAFKYSELTKFYMRLRFSYNSLEWTIRRKIEQMYRFKMAKAFHSQV